MRPTHMPIPLAAESAAYCMGKGNAQANNEKLNALTILDQQPIDILRSLKSARSGNSLLQNVCEAATKQQAASNKTQAASSKQLATSSTQKAPGKPK